MNSSFNSRRRPRTARLSREQIRSPAWVRSSRGGLTRRCSEPRHAPMRSFRVVNSSSLQPRALPGLVAMIVGGLLAVAPVFGPLGKTLHYLTNFIAERPQPMRAPDISFFVELLALIICPVGLLLFAISLVLFIRSGRRTAPRA